MDLKDKISSIMNLGEYWDDIFKTADEFEKVFTDGLNFIQKNLTALKDFIVNTLNNIDISTIDFNALNTSLSNLKGLPFDLSKAMPEISGIGDLMPKLKGYMPTMPAEVEKALSQISKVVGFLTDNLSVAIKTLPNNSCAS